MTDRSEKINHFLLQEQLPDIIKVAGTDKRSSNALNSKFSSTGTSSSSVTPGASFPKHSVSKRIVSAVDHVAQLRLDSCRCPQLEEYLPHILDLTVVRTIPSLRHPRGWSFANPVHALHMVGSQPGGESSSKVQKQRLPPTFMYGEEQHRTAALQTEGIAEYWCTFDGNSPDTSYVIRNQMEAAYSSKFTSKSAPKLLGQTGSPSPPKTASSTAASLAGSAQQILPSSNEKSHTKKTHVQSIISSMEESSEIPHISQGSTPIGPTDNSPPASLDLKVEPAQQNSITNGTKEVPSSVTNLSTEKKSALPSELGAPTSDQIPQGVQSNINVTSSDSTIEEAEEEIKKNETGISSPDKIIIESEKDTAPIGITPITVSETSPANTTFTSKTSSEIRTTNDSSSDITAARSEVQKALSATVDKEGKGEKSKIELVKNEHQTPDSLLPQLPGPTKDGEDSRVTLVDGPGFSPVTRETVKADNSTVDKERIQAETDTKDGAESSDQKTSSASKSKYEEESAVVTSSETNRIAEEVPPASRESNATENGIAAKSNATTEKEQSPVSKELHTNEFKAKAKADIALTKEIKASSEPIDSATETESSSQDVALSREKKDGSKNTSLPIESMESEKAIINSETKISFGVTMQSDHTNPDIVEVPSKAKLQDDPMEIKENDSAGVKVEEVKKVCSVTSESNQKSVAEPFCNGSKINHNDPKPIIVGSVSQLNQLGLSATTKAATRVVVEPIIISNASTTIQQQIRPQIRPQIPTMPFKSDPSTDHFRREEEKIRRARRSLTSKRVRKKSEPSTKEVNKKKRRVSEKSHVIPGWKIPPTRELSSDDEEEYMDATHKANETVERWMRQFRRTYESFLMDSESKNGLRTKQRSFSLEFDLGVKSPRCQWNSRKPSRPFTGDELMVCLDCGFVACSPRSLNGDTNIGMQQHLLVSGHKLAVSCGEKAQIFSSEYGDFVHHEIFEQEKLRIAVARKIPHMGWKEHAVLRSFDPFQFVKTPDSGILWRGLVATYPPMVPKEHFCAAQLTLRRKALFEGSCHENWILPKSNALYFSALQYLKTDEERFKISAPVGIYNLGNTCFMSSILQCLIHCKPLQQYFLRDSGHHHKSCEMFRHKEDLLTAAAASASTSAGASSTKTVFTKSKKPGNSTTVKKKSSKIESEVCLACEMDRLFLSYYSAASGNDVFPPIEESSRNLLLGQSSASPSFSPGEILVPIERGEPVIISDLLTSAWKSGGMNHLTGYDQHDAHEFLDSFLDILSKHSVKFRKRVHHAVTKVYKENAVVSEIDYKKVDIIRDLFEGSLRSVLLCETCGVKRIQKEPFMNISLSLSEKMEKTHEGCLSVETCLQHFVLPELLGDLVYCPSCRKRTPTKKQHTFANLPKILCLHLKRFDAAKNKKIEDFVSFPSHGLNMGVLLSHWCEVTRLGSKNKGSMPTAEPKILYDLFGTVNHIGNMQSGHYVANVKVDDDWYHSNDQHISYIKEDSVLKAEGAYVLFYIRR